MLSQQLSNIQYCVLQIFLIIIHVYKKFPPSAQIMNREQNINYVSTPTTAEFYMTQILMINTYVKVMSITKSQFCFHLQVKHYGYLDRSYSFKDILLKLFQDNFAQLMGNMSSKKETVALAQFIPSTSFWFILWDLPFNTWLTGEVFTALAILVCV